jgi:hypothetical protein
MLTRMRVLHYARGGEEEEEEESDPQVSRLSGSAYQRICVERIHHDARGSCANHKSPARTFAG